MLALVFRGDVSQWHVIHHSHQEALPLQSWRANVGRTCFNVLCYTPYPKTSSEVSEKTCVHVCMGLIDHILHWYKHTHSDIANASHTPATHTCQHVAHQGHRVFASWDICKMWCDGGWWRWCVCVCACLGTGVFSPRRVSQAGRLNALD